MTSAESLQATYNSLKPMFNEAKRHARSRLKQIPDQRSGEKEASYRRWLDDVRQANSDVTSRKNFQSLDHMRRSVKLQGMIKKPLVQGDLMRQRPGHDEPVKPSMLISDHDGFREASNSNSPER